MPNRRPHPDPWFARVFIAQIAVAFVFFTFLPDSAYPDWWFGEMNLIAGLALFAGMYFLSGWLSDVIWRQIERDQQ